MKGKSIFAFDTSGLNRLADDGNRDLLITTTLSGYEVRLPELATGEIYANQEFSRREALYEVCGRLLNNGYCISPSQWLISNLVKRHHLGPITFDWALVPWRSHADEKQISAGTILGDEQLATSQRENQKKVQKDFKTGFKKGSSGTWNDWIEQQKGNGGLLSIARNLYERALSYDDNRGGIPVAHKVELDEEALGKFADSCPPFRALVYAYALTAYDRGWTKRVSGEPRYNAGRNDQFMSVYLPYCEKFITAEEHHTQERCLKEVARAANLATEVFGL